MNKSTLASIYLAPLSLSYNCSFIYDPLFINPEATMGVWGTRPLAFQKTSCNENFVEIPPKNIHFGVFNCSL